MILYKYRSFSNIEFALDIFIKKRLYAAHFQSLNDPMEGKFLYDPGVIDKDIVKGIIGDKSDYGIIALSKNSTNHLLWSYYAESHSGFIVGVEISESDDISVHPVEYIENFGLENIKTNHAKKILLRKHKIWSHEEEYRVLKKLNGRNNRFVDIRIKELIFGTHSEWKNQNKKDIISRIASKFCPGILIKPIDEDEIERGLL